MTVYIIPPGTFSLPVNSRRRVTQATGAADSLAAAVWRYAARSLTTTSSGGLTIAEHNQLMALPIGPAMPTDITAARDAVLTQVAAVKAKTDNLPASPAAVGSAMTLTSAYDAAKSAASQASVTAIGSPLQASSYIAPDNAAAQSAATHAAAVDARLPVSPASTSSVPTAAANASAVRTELATELGRVDAAVSSRLATSGYTAPDNAAAQMAALNSAAVNSRLPASPAAVGSAMTLSSAYDSAKSAASQESVDAIGSPLQAASYIAPDNAAAQSAASHAAAVDARLPASPAAEGSGMTLTAQERETIIAAVRADLERTGGMLDGRSTLTDAEVWEYATRVITGGCATAADVAALRTGAPLPADIKAVNSVTITGTGVAGTDEWRPA